MLVPGGLVHPVVMATAGRNRDLVELRVKEKGASRALSAGGAPVDANAADVVPWVFPRIGLMPENAIGESGVLQVLPANVMKRLGAVGGSKN